MKTVLIVDDQPHILMVLKDFLKDFNCLKAESVKKAIEVFYSNYIDLILTDYQMPEESGLVLIKKIKETNENIPILLFSGYLVDDEASFLLNTFPKIDFIHKPFDLEELRTRIDNLLKD